MICKSLVGFAVLFSIQLAFAQDFKKSYELTSGGQIFVDNFNGDITVSGYGGKSVDVKAIRRGAGADSIQISDVALANRLDIMVRYPRVPGLKAAIDLEIRVPAALPLNYGRLHSVTGNVTVTNTVGRLRAESVRGSVAVKNVRGLISAFSVSGNVTVEIDRGQGPSNMRFGSISGDVLVSAPANLDAFIEMSSASGLLRSDFPIDIQERRYGPGREARGKLGSGRQVLWINSNSGRVSLIQRPERQAS